MSDLRLRNPSPTAPSSPHRRRRRAPRSGRQPAPGGARLQPRLWAEWDRLRDDPAAVAAARSWQVTHVHFDDLDTLLELAGYAWPGGSGPEHEPDREPESRSGCEAVLLRLVLAARDEPLAARIVLQRILPGLLARVRPHARHRGVDGVFEELAAAAWITIREYDPRRRPRCLAAALIASADHLAFGRQARQRRPVVVREPSELDAVTDRAPTARDELAEVIVDARAVGVTDQDLAVVHGLVAVGSPSGLAAALGVTPRTIRNRRDRAVARLRAATEVADTDRRPERPGSSGRSERPEPPERPERPRRPVRGSGAAA